MVTPPHSQDESDNSVFSLEASPTISIIHCSWTGNFQREEIQRQPCSVTESAGYDDSGLPALGTAGTDIREAYNRSCDSIGVEEALLTPSDVRETGAFASTSTSSHRQVKTTQSTHNTNRGQLEQARYFACPFFKHDFSKYQKTCSKGWMQIHRLKHVSLTFTAMTREAYIYILQRALVSTASSTEAKVYTLPSSFQR